MPTGLAHYEGDFFAFDYPAAWGAMVTSCGKSIDHCEGDPCFTPGCGITLVDLSTAPFVDPCHTVGNADICGFPIATLGSNGIYASWVRQFPFDGIPSIFSFDPTANPVVSAGGRTASWQIIDPARTNAACGDVGGTTAFEAVVPDPAATVWSTHVFGCITGPDTDAIELQVRQMLQSIQWLRPADFHVEFVAGQNWTIRTDVFDPAGLARSVRRLDDTRALLLSNSGGGLSVSHGGRHLDVAWVAGICASSIIGLAEVDGQFVVTLDRGRGGPCLSVGIGEGISITLSDPISADNVELRDW